MRRSWWSAPRVRGDWLDARDEHDFESSLALSNGFADAPWWLDIYRKASPTMISADEGRRSAGRVQKPLACDFIAYAFAPSRRCYLLPGFVGLGYNGDPASGQILPGSPLSGENPRVAFRYDHTSQTYTLVTLDLVTSEDRFSLSKPRSTPPILNIPMVSSSDTPEMFSMEPAFSSCTNPEARTRASARLFGVRPSDEACLTGSFEFQRLLVWVWTRNGRSRRSEKRHGDLLRVMYGFAVDPPAGKQYEIEGTSSLILDFATQKTIRHPEHDGSRERRDENSA
jgi:hypothetical protein